MGVSHLACSEEGFLLSLELATFTTTSSGVSVFGKACLLLGLAEGDTSKCGNDGDDNDDNDGSVVFGAVHSCTVSIAANWRIGFGVSGACWGDLWAISGVVIISVYT